jgi:hypothetical protein
VEEWDCHAVPAPRVVFRSCCETDFRVSQDELSPVIQDLAPVDCKAQIPFLAVSDDLGSRSVVCERTSGLSGGSFVTLSTHACPFSFVTVLSRTAYVIEDVASSREPGVQYRRMFFRSNMMSVQSEARCVL